MRTLSAVGLLLLCHAAGLAAQWPAEITPGARVRLQLPEAQYQLHGARGQLLRGRVAALSADTLYLAITDSVGPVGVPKGLIQRLHLSRGVPSRAGSALKRGIFAGASTALLMALLSGLNDEPDAWDAGTAAAVGGGVGLATGAIFGALYPLERWKAVRWAR